MMRIRSIELKDFRGIAQLELQFPEDPPLLVLLGENGAGKSTVLDAAALILSVLAALITNAHVDSGKSPGGDIYAVLADLVHWDSGKSPGGARQITNRDIPRGQIRRGELMAYASADMEVFDCALDLGLRLPAKGLSCLVFERHDPTPFFSALNRRIVDGAMHPLPVIAVYRTNRAVLDVPQRIGAPPHHDSLPLYERAFAPKRNDFRVFFNWFGSRQATEDDERFAGYLDRDPQLEAVRSAVSTLMPGYKELRMRRRPLALTITKDGHELGVDQLSDGEKCLLAIGGDIARRLVLANPDAVDPLQGSGVVLIDEVELHLHPRWQRTVVPALRRAFPNVQFILTTQSPQVAASVPAHCIRILRQTADGIQAVVPQVSEGLDTNSILTILMETTDRPEDVSRQLEELFDLISQREWARAEAALDGVREIPGAESEALKAETLIRLGRKLAAR